MQRSYIRTLFFVIISSLGLVFSEAYFVPNLAIAKETPREIVQKVAQNSAAKKSHASPKLVLDIANNHIDITTGFDGAPIYIHGFIERPDSSSLYDIAVIIKGPTRKTVIRRKEQILGMWMNRASAEFENVYSFYDLAATRPIAKISDAGILRDNGIGLDYLDFQPNANATRTIDIDVLANFQEALIRTKQSRGLYALSEKEIHFISGPFFKASFSVPASVPTGRYIVEGYLFHEGILLDRQSVNLTVAQVGVNADIFIFARDNAFLYGVMAIMIALVFGWSAHSFLSRPDK